VPPRPKKPKQERRTPLRALKKFVKRAGGAVITASPIKPHIQVNDAVKNVYFKVNAPRSAPKLLKRSGPIAPVKKAALPRGKAALAFRAQLHGRQRQF
jgi:hypothetical protein